MKEIATVTVYPTKASSLLLEHPTHGPMTNESATWPNDVFTKRRLTDGSVSKDKPATPAPVSAPTPAPIAAMPVTPPVITPAVTPIVSSTSDTKTS